MTFPVVNTGRVRLGGSLWVSDFSPNTGSAVAELVCGTSMGNAPRDLADYALHTEFSVVQRVAAGGATRPAELWRARGDLLSLGNLTDEMATAVACLSVPNALTTGTPDIPGFLFFGVSGGVVVYRHIPANDILSPTIDSGTAWDNELAITNAELRVVDLPSGPWAVVPGPSTNYTGDGLWLRALGLASTATAAVEVDADLLPVSTLTLDLTRMHVIGHDDGTVTVYYRVFSADGTYDGTAAVIVQSSDASIVASPRLLLNGFVPVVSNCAALRHPANGQVVLALEPADADAGTSLYWFASTGNGLRLDVLPLEWSATTHPSVFGGRFNTTAPDARVTVCGMGWCDNKAGGGFRVFAQHVLGAVSASYRDVASTFNTGATNNATARRALSGELAVTLLSGDASAAGTFQWLGANAAAWELSTRAARGYDMTIDAAAAVLLAPLDDLSNEDVRVVVGEAAGARGVSTVLRLAPAPGPMRGSLGFNDQDASVRFACPEGTYATEEVTVSVWVYPRASSVPGVNVIASRPLGTDETWGLYWNDATGDFVVRYSTVADGPLTFNTGALAFDDERWYHLTFTYDGTTARLFVNGTLVASDTPAVGGALDTGTATDPVYLGADGNERSAFMRVEEFVVGAVALTPQQVLHVFTHGLTNNTGPVACSRLATGADRVIACAVATATNAEDTEEGPVYLLGMRYAAIGTGAAVSVATLAAIDVWRRSRGRDPVYVGTLPAPAQLCDYTVVAAGYGTRPSFAAENARWDAFAYAAGDGLVAYIPFVSADTGDAHMMRYSVGDLADIYGTTTIDHVATLDVSATGHVPMHGSTVVLTGGGDPYVLLPRGTADGVTQSLYVLRAADFGVNPWATAAAVPVTDLLPAAAETHEGIDFNTDFGDGATGNVRIDGIVGRIIREGMGFAPAQSGDLQILYGLSSPGTGTTVVTNLVATAGAVLSISDIDAGTTPISVATPVQLDEYGRGGIEPFVPLRWLAHPGGVTGDSLLLVSAGLRTHSANGYGDGGLEIYRLKRDGMWSIRPAAPVPFSTVRTHRARRGADVAFSVDPAYQNEYVLSVVRPYDDAAERFSAQVLSSAEATDAGYTLASPGALNLVLRSYQQRHTVLVTDHVVQTRHFTDERTGNAVRRGTRYAAAPFVRWSAPGRPYPIDSASYDSTDFHDQVHPALQGGCYSPGARLARFWTVNGNDLTPAAGGKQFRLPGSGNYLRASLVNLGNVRPAYGGTRVAPIGIVDDAVAQVGRYVYLTYAGDNVTPATVRSYDSPYDDELNSALSSVVLWSAVPAVGEHGYRSMRVVMVGGVLYLYFVIAQTLYVKALPAVGSASVSTAAVAVATLSVTVESRIYAVAQDDGRVAIYLGDEDSASVCRTVALVHSPTEAEVIRPESTVFSGAVPFALSYAACRGLTRDSVDHTVVMLEPASSQGGREAPTVEPLLGECSGNAWLCVSFTTDGYHLLDQMVLDSVPFRDASHAAGHGGRERVRTWPNMLTRITDPEADVDLSTEYVLHTAVKGLGRENSIPALTKFRHDFTPGAGERTNDLGGSVLTSTFDAGALELIGSVEEKPLYAMLVPGSLLLEPIGGMTFDGLPYAVTQTPANPLDAWSLLDTNAADGGGGTPNVTQDQVHGLRAHAPLPGVLFLAGWFALGEPG